MTPKALTLAAALALVALAPAAQAAPQTDHAIHAVVGGPQRAAANVARDPWRHPAESLSFWGLKPGATVVELSPGGGYWTEILTPYLKTTSGHYVAALGGDPAPFKAKYADAAVYGVIETTPLTKDSGPYLPAGSADLVITSRNIHNFIYQGTLDKVMADAFAALKHGGYLGVEEHRADPRPMKPDVSDGYVSEALVIAAAEKAGFKLDARSEINANPKDTKDHPFGVWTLPPSRTSAAKDQAIDPNFDRARYDAIGESDRMTLRFRKPG